MTLKHICISLTAATLLTVAGCETVKTTQAGAVGVDRKQRMLVSEQEVVKQAENHAEDIIEEARAREREIRLGAEDYADDILSTLEVNLQKFLQAVQRGRDRLQGREREPSEIG